jgi:hypothetical protein
MQERKLIGETLNCGVHLMLNQGMFRRLKIMSRSHASNSIDVIGEYESRGAHFYERVLQIFMKRSSTFSPCRNHLFYLKSLYCPG